MYTLKQIEQYARTCRIYDLNSGASVCGVLLSIAGKTVMCLPDARGCYRWTVDRVPTSDLTVERLLKSSRNRP